MSHDRAYLRQRLLERASRPQAAAALDAELWSLLGVDLAILVSDLSGFTRLSRQCGITHFLALHYTAVELAHPLFTAHTGVLRKTEADNLIATFSDPADAARCALAMQRASRDYNGSGTEANSRIDFGLGLGYGRVLGLTDDVFGIEVNTAYKLGEDIARPGEILVSPAEYEAIAAVPGFQFSEELQARTGSIDVRYRLLTNAGP